jgi:hypothetical protein
MTEERFFNEVHNRMEGFAPQVPSSVYVGMRRKLWWSNFSRFRAAHLNVWYVALVPAAALLWIGTATTSTPAEGHAATGTTPALRVAARVTPALVTPSTSCAASSVTTGAANNRAFYAPPRPVNRAEATQTETALAAEGPLTGRPMATVTEATAPVVTPEPAPAVTGEVVSPSTRRGWDSIGNDKKVDKKVVVKTTRDRQ